MRSLSCFIINGVIVYTVIIELLLFYIINYGGYQKTINAMLLVVSAGIILTTIYVVCTAYTINEKNSKLLYAQMIQIQNQEKESQIQEIGRADLRERQLVHDYRNHCLSMQELLDKERYGEVKQYLEEMTGKYMRKEKEYIHTQNKAIDAVLNAKIALCREKDVSIYCTVVGNLKAVRGLEFSSILFNLLDNAIEASMKITEPKKRRIEVLVCKESLAVEIFVKNTVMQSVLESNGELISDKKQAGHGIGHISVEASVDTLDGLIRYYEEDQMFCVHIFVPYMSKE